MKKLFSILIISFIAQLVFAQACGFYRVKYVGQVVSNNIEIVKIKIASVDFLQGIGKKTSEIAFIEAELIGNKIERESRSYHLTHHLYDDPNRYLNLYQSKHESLPIIFVIQKGNEIQEIEINLSWDKIKMIKIEDEKFGNNFQIDLGKIEITT